jgi:hypothetical protein
MVYFCIFFIENISFVLMYVLGQNRKFKPPIVKKERKKLKIEKVIFIRKKYEIQKNKKIKKWNFSH